MSMQFAKDAVRSLIEQYGTTKKLTLTMYTVGPVDFQNAAPNNGVDSITVSGIALPKTLNTVFLPRSTLPVDRKFRPFLIETRRCKRDWVKEGNYLTYLGERYNIKFSDVVEDIYYYILATSDGDESYDFS